MAKVKGGLFSLEAKGTLKKTLVYQGSQSGGKVNLYKKKVDKQTERQLLVRTLFDEARQRWNASTMAIKTFWNQKAKHKNKTGYDLFLSNSIINLRTMDYEEFHDFPVSILKKGAKPPTEASCGLFACLNFGEEGVEANEEFVFVKFHIPSNHKPGSNIEFALYWLSEGETTGDVLWEISLVSVEADTDQTPGDSPTVKTVVSTVNPDLVGLAETDRITFDGSLFNIHDVVGIQIKRKSSDALDTLSGDASLIMVERYHISDRLGKKV